MLENPLSHLPEALADLCARDGRQKREIARAASLSPAMLSAYTTGRKEPSIESLGRLLAGLGVTLSDLEAALDRVRVGAALPRQTSTLEAIKAELLAAVDQRLAEFGYKPGTPDSKSTKPRAHSAAERAPRAKSRP